MPKPTAPLPEWDLVLSAASRLQRILQSKQFATRGDAEAPRAAIERSRSEFLKELVGRQRRTVVAMAIIVGLFAALQKLL